MDNIKPEEVESIKVIGELHGDEVKVIKTIGGFFCAVGRKSKNKKTVEPLAAGSHVALVSHQLEKQFKNDFQPAMFKSESEVLPVVKEYTKKLPQELVDAGFELYTLTKNEKVNFVATKQGAEVVNFEGSKTSEGYELDRVSPVSNKVSKEIGSICHTIAEIINDRR
jgi:hypothetical protein